MIAFRDVSFGYTKQNVIDNVSFGIEDGAFLGITGTMGSGKTTLCKLICGLQKPTNGAIEHNTSIAFAMQFPESQLFESTVLKDVMFGPLNRGLDRKRAEEIAISCLKLMGIEEDLFSRNPLSLSGGEKRRVALAGVLAMESDVLVLDEPTVGLDCCWHDELFRVLRKLNEDGKTIVMVSHDIDDIAENCNSMLVLDEGKITDFGNVREVVLRHDELETRALSFSRKLKIKDCVTIGELADLIAGSENSR